MIIIGPRAIAGDFLGELARAEELARDLARVSEGYRPSEDDLNSAPMLEDWALSLRSAPCLIGRPSGHPYLRGPRPVTSYLFVHAPELGWARTWSRYYRLGRPGEQSAGL